MEKRMKEKTPPIPQQKKRRRKKKKLEFSKKLVIWALLMTTICIAISYWLSWSDHDSCQEITVAVVTTCIAIAVSYEAKSYGEKNSRNKYGVDEEGRKLSAKQPEDEEAVG